jgi:predicted flap endonuclease-1-like 5' DNA nuclease
MLNFLNEANWWCLLLLLFLAFLLGRFVSKRTFKKKYKKALDECERENTMLKNATNEKANSTFSIPENGIKAVKTSDHGGIAISGRGETPRLNFDSFGKADASQKDDLKLISGIGPFIEEKLNSIGIYTFDQISKFTSEDIDTVTTLIQFFPGRIERDKWTKQAEKLKNK